jgi:Fe-S cluster biogenesis protein NfuA
LKFLPGRTVLATGTLEMRDKAEAAQSPLAERLFDVPGVGGVFFGSDFITVTKTAGEWPQLKPAILGAIMEHFMSGARSWRAAPATTAEARVLRASDAETVATIKELIETRVRPAVANDGGDITFRGYKDGVVYLAMKGSCSGCPSSTATLKHGIQNLLRIRAGRDRSPADLLPRRLSGECPVAENMRNAIAIAEVQMRVLRRLTAGAGSCAFWRSTPRSEPARPPCSIRARRRSSRASRCRMARGHAEAIMPLIARVMDAARCEFAELERIAVTVGPGSFTGLRVGFRRRAALRSRPASRRSACHALGARSARMCGAHRRHHHRGDRCAQRAGLFPGLRAERHTIVTPRLDACAPRCAPCRSGRRHHRLRRDAGRGAVAERLAAAAVEEHARARHRLGRAARRGRAGRRLRRRSRSICAGPTRARRMPAAAAPMSGFRTPVCRAEPALGDAHPRDAAALARLHGSLVQSRLERERDSSNCSPTASVMRTVRRAGRKLGVHPVAPRAPTRRRFSRSRWRARAQGRGLARGCSICICAGSRASAARACFSRSTRTTSRRSGSTLARDFARSAAGRATTGGKERRLVLRGLAENRVSARKELTARAHHDRMPDRRIAS